MTETQKMSHLLKKSDAGEKSVFQIPVEEYTINVNLSRPGPRCSTDGEKIFEEGRHPQKISSTVNGSKTGTESIISADERSVNVNRNSDPFLSECGPRSSKDSQTSERIPTNPRNTEMRNLLSIILRFESPVVGELNSQQSIDVNIDGESFWNRGELTDCTNGSKKSDTVSRDCAEVVMAETQKTSHLLEKIDAGEKLVENRNLSHSGPRYSIAGGRSTPETRDTHKGLTGNNCMEIEPRTDGETVSNKQGRPNEIFNSSAEEDKTKKRYADKNYSLSCQREVSRQTLLKYNCWHCEEFYGTERDLGWHLSREFPQHPYMCLHCPKEIAFDSEDLYRKHTLWHEEQDKNENRFVIFCPHCDGTCDTEEAMNAHIQNMHSHDIASTTYKGSRESFWSESSTSDDMDGRSDFMADQRQSEEEGRIIERVSEIAVGRSVNDEYNLANSSSNSAEDDAMLAGPSTRSRTRAKLIKLSDSDSGMIESDTNSEKAIQSLYWQSMKNSSSHPEQLEQQKLAHLKDSTYTSRSRSRKLRKGSSFKSQLKSITCDVCGKLFTQKGHLYSHKRAIHDEESPYVCNVCGQSFTLNGSLKRHKRAIHDKEKPYTCNVCGKSFAHSGHLYRHKRSIHDKKKPFMCSECGKSFAQNDTLCNHRRVIHDDYGPFSCNMCKKKFSTKNTLVQHIEQTCYRF